MVSALSQAYPHLRIVGEEDGDSGAAPDEQSQRSSPLRTDLLDAGDADSDAWLPLSELTVFIDPVDGTREFVEGRLGAVQTLVGVARRGRAVAGAVGLPFPDGSLGAEPVVAWGLAEGGGAPAGGVLGGALPASASGRLADGGLVSCTGDSSNVLLAVAREIVAADANAVIGGAGNKLLAVAQGRADVALMHFGTSLWDTCAPEAVVRARGGRVTDLFGAPLLHDAGGPAGLINRLGVLATGPDAPPGLHGELCARMRASAALLGLLDGVEAADAPQAADVARCLSGAPLELRWLEASLQPEGAAHHELVRYSAPEAGTVRGLMSEACRLELTWRRREGAPADAPEPPASAFYKRVAMAELEHARLKARTAPLKLARDTRSYAVEAGFLGSAACEALVEAGVPVARAFAVDLRPCERDPIESRFAMLLQEFRADEGWAQHWLCKPQQARAALAGLAKLHAFFWEGSAFWRADADGGAACDELRSAVWPSGCYWQPSMQPAEQLTTLVAHHWPEHLHNFAETFAASPMLEGVELESVGERLQRVAAAVAAEAHPFGECGCGEGAKTLVHGDPKSANIFFRQGPGSAADDVEVGYIDMQWSGFGLAATDVAHHIVAGLDIECLSADGCKEEALLDHYHASLVAQLVELGGFPEAQAARLLPRETLQAQYEAAVLDMCRVVFAYQWARVKASPATLAKNAPSMGRNSYNKSVDHACWLVRQCDNMLRRREARTAAATKTA